MLVPHSHSFIFSKQKSPHFLKLKEKHFSSLLYVSACSQMAEANISVAREQFSCPVCLDLLKDPVTIPCGHSYCINCITECWNQEDAKGVYSCPQCREDFNSRPALNKSTILAEMVEKLKNTKLQTPDHCYAGPGDVGCDVCSGSNTKPSNPVWFV